MRVNVKFDLRICVPARAARKITVLMSWSSPRAMSSLELPLIQSTFLNFLGFKFQSNFLGFIFQNGLDSGFKIQIGGIQDSDLGLQGPKTSSGSVLPSVILSVSCPSLFRQSM